MSFIEKLSENENLVSLLKLQKANQQDGTTAEQVLKFFAYKNNSEHFKGAVAEFLNKYTEGVENHTSGFEFTYSTEETIFTETMEFLANIVGGPFLRPSTHITPLVQFEAVTVAVGTLIQEGVTPSMPPENWMDDPALVSASSAGANTRSKLARRIERARELFSGCA